MTPSTWLPDRPPTWTDVATAVLAAVLLVVNLASLETIAWAWVAVGFVATAVAGGPVASSPVGAWVGDRFRAIGPLGRGVVIVLFAVGVWSTVRTIEIPTIPVISLVGGGFLAIVVIVPIHVLYVGEVSGWRAT